MFSKQIFLDVFFFFEKKLYLYALNEALKGLCVWTAVQQKSLHCICKFETLTCDMWYM